MKLLKGIMVLMAGLFFLGFANMSESQQDPDPNQDVIEEPVTLSQDQASKLTPKPSDDKK